MRPGRHPDRARAACAAAAGGRTGRPGRRRTAQARHRRPHGVAATAVIHGVDHDTVTLSDGSWLDTEQIVLSVGVRPDTEVFEAAGVACRRGAIVVDGHGRTSLPGVWAVGDATASTDAVTGAVRPVALAGPANRAGRQVADDIVRPGSARSIPQPLGTAIVEWANSPPH